MRNLLEDIWYALRSFRKTPTFTVAALAALTIGIGANTAIFSVVDRVLIKPLPYPDANRIVSLFVTTPQGPYYGASVAKFNVWREQIKSFQEVAAYEYRGADLGVVGGAIPEQVHSIRVSADYFHLLGASMAEGRPFTNAEDRPGGGHPVILSYGLWQRRFGGNDKILGQWLALNGRPYEIVGVVGSGFNTELDTPPDIFLPFQIDPNSADHAQYFSVVARLRPSATLAGARAQLQVAAILFRERFPRTIGAHDGFGIEPFAEALVSDSKSPLMIFTGAVVLVLLIACANVANLLLVRGTNRKRELAIRSALGASRARLVRQFLTESIVLSIIGGALGLILGEFGVRSLIGFNSGLISRINQHGTIEALDGHVLLFTLLLSLLTGILFGLVPALNISGNSFATSFKEGGSTGTSIRQHRIRSMFVAGETALAMVLLIGAGLLTRSFFELRTVKRGVDIDNVLTLRTSTHGTQPLNSAEVTRLVQQTEQRVGALPGVQAVSASYMLPLQGAFGIPFNILGRPKTTDRYDGRGWLAVSPGYFGVFKIPINRGRMFSSLDNQAGAPVAIINESLAHRFWPHSNPVGSDVVLGENYGPEFKDSAREIVGVVGDVLDFGSKAPQPVVYIPIAQVNDGITGLLSQVSSLTWSVRTKSGGRLLTPAIKNVLQKTSANVIVTSVRQMREVFSNATGAESFQATLLTIFAATALLLAAIGMYGLVSYSVEQRTREIGIRLAIGAPQGLIKRMLLLEGLAWGFLGVGVGIVAAIALTRFLTNLLFGVAALDTLTFLSIPLFLIAVLLLAVWIPSRRATLVDPMVALRAE